MRTLVIVATLAAAVPAWGHEGHEHGSPPKAAVPQSASPRFEALTEDLEVVGVVDAGTLTLYIDRRLTNEPVADAQVEVEGMGIKAVGQQVGRATYRLSFPEPPVGKHPLAITVQAGDLVDLVAADLEITAPIPAATTHQGVPSWLPWAVGGGVTLVGISWMTRRGLRWKQRKD